MLCVPREIVFIVKEGDSSEKVGAQPLKALVNVQKEIFAKVNLIER